MAEEARAVVMTVAADGSMTVTVDGTPVPPSDGEWVRESFAVVLDQVTSQHRESAVVEVRESDGSVFTERVPATPERTRAQAEPWAEVAGSGFLPGEQVAVAVVMQHLTANPDGTVQAWISPKLSCCRADLLLMGPTSGTLQVGAG